MVYPRVTFMEKKWKILKNFVLGAGLLSRNFVAGAGLLNENFSGPGVIPGRE